MSTPFCDNCKGKGTVTLKSGFFTVERTCVVCYGTGMKKQEAQPDRDVRCPVCDKLLFKVTPHTIGTAEAHCRFCQKLRVIKMEGK